jgi:hypothetical protein
MGKEEDLVEVAVLSRMARVLALRLCDHTGDCPPPDPERPCQNLQHVSVEDGHGCSHYPVVGPIVWNKEGACERCWMAWARKVAGGG